MPVTRRSQAEASVKSESASPSTTRRSSRLSTSTPSTIEIVDDSDDFQPDLNLNGRTLRKRKAAEVESSDVETIIDLSSASESPSILSGSRRKGKGKANPIFTSSSSLNTLLDVENTPATSVSDDYETIKVDSDVEDVKMEVIEDDDSDNSFRVDVVDDDSDDVESVISLHSDSDAEEDDTPLSVRAVNTRRSTANSRRRRTTTGTGSESGSSNDESGTPLAERSRIQVQRTLQRARARRARAARRSEPQKSWFERVNDKLIANHPELENVWDDLDNAFQAVPTPVEQPKELMLPLLPFQKEGVGWMRQQELSPDFKGGILADEMGMGKTIQTIAMLLEEPRKKPNLVVAPTVALVQWKREIETHTNCALKVLLYHGANRSTDIDHLKEYDVVLSTYSILEIAFRRQEYGFKREGNLVKERSILHRIPWHRIILDEAHNIKDRSNNTARSVFNLQSEYKWSLSGTPLQNRVGELYSLIRFMQADPFGYYYCKTCPCKSLTWKFSDKRTCDHCGHKPMDHVCWWNNEILKPIQRYGTRGTGLLAFKKLRKLLDKMMLRRTKLERADDLGLPPRTVVVRRDLFNEEEEDMYQSLYSDSARKFSTYVEHGTVLNNYANIFELLMKMRQCSNHPDLVLKRDKTGAQQLVCVVCNEPPEDAIMSSCRHIFCRECCVQYLESFVEEGTMQMKTPNCPRCFATLTVDLSQPAMETDNSDEPRMHAKYSKNSIVNRINMDKWRSSTKIEALVEELTSLQAEDRSIKSIVFSQFVNFLDLVHWRLSRAGFECVKLDGTMSPHQRDAAIKHFMTNPSVTVFLISLKAGGVALNLTEASRVFICDPWWNPAAELQAMDRIHRLGQYRPIKITRLIIENSIESRIVQLQEKKTALVESTIGKDADALARLSEEDLRFLFVM